MIVLLLSLFQSFSFQGYAGCGTGYTPNELLGFGSGYINMSEEKGILSFSQEFRMSYTVPAESLMYSFDRVVLYVTPYPVSFSIGKERVNWGFGMFYSPADIFNSHYSVLDYERTRAGVLSTGVSYEWNSNIIQEFVVALPQDSIRIRRDNLRIGSSLNLFFGSYETFLSLVRVDDELPISIGVRKDFLNFVFYSEATVKPPLDSLRPQFLFGFNRMLGAAGMIDVEYFYQYAGMTKWKNVIPELMYPLGYTGKHYIYAFTQVGRERWFSTGLYSVFNPVWGGGLAGLIVSYSGFRDITLTGTGIKILKGGEFNQLPYDYMLGLEMRYYY